MFEKVAIEVGLVADTIATVFHSFRLRPQSLVTSDKVMGLFWFEENQRSATMRAAQIFNGAE